MEGRKGMAAKAGEAAAATAATAATAAVAMATAAAITMAADMAVTAETAASSGVQAISEPRWLLWWQRRHGSKATAATMTRNSGSNGLSDGGKRWWQQCGGLVN